MGSAVKGFRDAMRDPQEDQAKQDKETPRLKQDDAQAIKEGKVESRENNKV
jgi:Sec-independent protein translocase protein TatA